MKENSIEEDIILLKDFTEGNFKRDKLENYKGSYKMGYFYYKDIQQAIEHILSDYKRVLKENEELKKSKITYEDVRDIQEKNKNIVDNNYISKQKVKDKIEEYKKESAELYRKFLESGESNNAMRDIRMICQAKAQVLQELIKEREE